MVTSYNESAPTGQGRGAKGQIWNGYAIQSATTAALVQWLEVRHD